MTSDEIAQAFARAGFRIEHTGGGCECYRREGPTRGVLGARVDTVEIVTMHDDAILPTDLDDEILIGLYTRHSWENETGNHPLTQRYSTVREYLAELQSSKTRKG